MSDVTGAEQQVRKLSLHQEAFLLVDMTLEAG